MSNLSSAGSLSVSGNFSCVGNVNLSGQLTSSADGYFNSITTFLLNSATLQVSGDATLATVQISSGVLNISGNLQEDGIALYLKYIDFLSDEQKASIQYKITVSLWN